MQSVDLIKEHFRDPKAKELAVLLWQTLAATVGKQGIDAGQVAYNLMHRIPTHPTWAVVSGAVMPHLLMTVQYVGQANEASSAADTKLFIGLAVNSLLNVMAVMNSETQPLVPFSNLLNKLGNGAI